MSNEPELVVLCNTKGHPVGSAEKLSTHNAHTPLHLAFSCYVFNDDGQILITKRAAIKKVWPGVWTNTVCGHPAPGEDMLAAIRRRLDYELGMTAANTTMLVEKYMYKTPPFNGVIEHEFCPVFAAVSNDQPKPNPLEVDDYEWISWADYTARLANDTSDTFSWWSKDQLAHISVDTLAPFIKSGVSR